MSSIENALEGRLTEAKQQFCMGQVTATPSPKVTVTTTGGASLTIPRLASYTPVITDVVLIAMTPAGWIVLGKVA